MLSIFYDAIRSNTSIIRTEKIVMRQFSSRGEKALKISFHNPNFGKYENLILKWKGRCKFLLLFFKNISSFPLQFLHPQTPFIFTCIHELSIQSCVFHPPSSYLSFVLISLCFLPSFKTLSAFLLSFYHRFSSSLFHSPVFTLNYLFPDL